MAYTMVGRLSTALPLLEQAVTQATARHLLMSQPQAMLALGEAKLRAGHVSDAEGLAMQALALEQRHGAQGVQAWTLRLLGDIAAQRQPVLIEPAIQWYRQALALAHPLAMQPLMAHCHLGLGRMSVQAGQTEAARTALSTAATLFDTMAMTHWLTPTVAALTSLQH
jgi:tetratricopeptide (TPR) repeat protein